MTWRAYPVRCARVPKPACFHALAASITAGEDRHEIRRLSGQLRHTSSLLAAAYFEYASLFRGGERNAPAPPAPSRCPWPCE